MSGYTGLPIWGTMWRTIAAGAALGGSCGVLYILIQGSIGMARHPDAGAVPAVLILTYFGAIAGVLSGTALGVLNGILVATLAIPIVRLVQTHPATSQLVPFGVVALAAGAVNFLAVRAILDWWLSGGTISFVQFPLVFGWAAAVLADLWVTRWVYRGRPLAAG